MGMLGRSCNSPPYSGPSFKILTKGLSLNRIKEMSVSKQARSRYGHRQHHPIGPCILQGGLNSCQNCGISSSPGWHRAPGSSSCQNETFGEVSKSWGPFIVSSFLITRRFLTGIVTACHTYLYNEFKDSLSHETMYQKKLSINITGK